MQRSIENEIAIFRFIGCRIFEQTGDLDVRALLVVGDGNIQLDDVMDGRERFSGVDPLR